MHEASVMRVAVAQFVNTAAVLVLVNAATGPKAPLYGFVATDVLCPPALQGFVVRCALGPNGVLLHGEHFDIGPRWYADVGESTLLSTRTQVGPRAPVDPRLCVLRVPQRSSSRCSSP